MTTKPTQPFALWRLRHPVHALELACLVAEPQPGLYHVTLALDGQPLIDRTTRQPWARRTRNQHALLTAFRPLLGLLMFEDGWYRAPEEATS